MAMSTLPLLLQAEGESKKPREEGALQGEEGSLRGAQYQIKKLKVSQSPFALYFPYFRLGSIFVNLVKLASEFIKEILCRYATFPLQEIMHLFLS